MEFSETCPLCRKPLELKQINLQTAVLICADVKCPYPCFEECFVVERDVKNIKKPIDIHAQLKKQELRNASAIEQVAENSILLELEDLLNSQANFNDVNNSGREKDINENSLQNTFEHYQQNDQSLNLPELDAFLNDLLT